jgi:hypothetical protein
LFHNLRASGKTPHCTPTHAYHTPQVSRCFYDSRAAFLADCEMIVAAAAAYNTLGCGRLATPPLIAFAERVRDEAKAVLDNPDLFQSFSYWEARVQVGGRMLLTDPRGFACDHSK